jgi:D-glycero-alpha-D-manno-heptose-7-phosphate kinase
MNLDNFLVDQNLSIRDALEVINLNHTGTVFVVDADQVVIGTITDGDVRRFLLNGGDLDECINLVINREFIYLNVNDNREVLLKHLDRRARIIPILSLEKRLVNVISRDSLPIIEEVDLQIRARAPVRISFGGGGSDLTNFFFNQSGAVINATVSIYCHVLLSLRSDMQVHLCSNDLDAKVIGKNLDDVLATKSELGLIQAVLRVIRPSFGFDLIVSSDFPVGSGLGGSATVAVAILGVFNHLRMDKWTKYEIAELAFEAERFYLGVSGGWQDQYASVFGGLNFMEFAKEQNLVIPLNMDKEVFLELSENLILCNTGIKHDSGSIHDDQKNQVLDEDVILQVKKNVELTYFMRDSLLRGNLNKFGESLNSAWSLKKQFSNKISNARIDEIYDCAMKNGALGGKLLGAGGGGFFLFYVQPNSRHSLKQYLKNIGLEIYPFLFESDGLVTWAVRK